MYLFSFLVIPRPEKKSTHTQVVCAILSWVNEIFFVVEANNISQFSLFIGGYEASLETLSTLIVRV